MDFGNRLLEARRTRGMNQEELAEALGVSRQTIYKWEAGITYPDIDKLCDIARHLGVSTSYLLGESDAAPAAPAAAEEKHAVLRHFRGFSRMIGGATLLILLSVGILIALCTRQSTLAIAAGITVLLVGVFAAAICYVIAGLQHDAFLKENTLTFTFSREERGREQRGFAIRIALGLALICIGVLTVVMLGVFEQDQFVLAGVVVMLFLIGVACYFFITAGIMHELYTNTDEALLSEEKRSRGNLEDAVSGVIMTLATVIFLLCGFVFNLWHPAWVVFPIGGVLCGCASSVIKLRGARRNETEREREKD